MKTMRNNQQRKGDEWMNLNAWWRTWLESEKSVNRFDCRSRFRVDAFVLCSTTRLVCHFRSSFLNQKQKKNLFSLSKHIFFVFLRILFHKRSISITSRDCYLHPWTDMIMITRRGIWHREKNLKDDEFMITTIFLLFIFFPPHLKSDPWKRIMEKSASDAKGGEKEKEKSPKFGIQIWGEMKQLDYLNETDTWKNEITIGFILKKRKLELSIIVLHAFKIRKIPYRKNKPGKKIFLILLEKSFFINRRFRRDGLKQSGIFKAVVTERRKANKIV